MAREKAAPKAAAKAADPVTEKIAGGKAKAGKADAGKSAAGDAKAKSAKSITKGQFLTELAAHAEMSKPEVAKVLDAMSKLIVQHLGTKGTGVIALPGLLKLKAKRVKAVKGGQSVPNRFKPGEMTTTKDKPAHTKVSVRPLKGLKELLK